MGCLPSRSTTVSPVDSKNPSSKQASSKRPNGNNSRYIKQNGYQGANEDYDRVGKQLVDSGTSFDREGGKQLSMSNSLNEGPEDDIMSILLADQEKRTEADSKAGSGVVRRTEHSEGKNTPGNSIEREGAIDRPPDEDLALASPDVREDGSSKQPDVYNESSLDDELNIDLLRQYIAVDYEITQLEDRDALRIYHEKIEQLEQLERELDMISSEVEEVAARSEIKIDRFQASNGDMIDQGDSKDLESNSILSGVTNSMSLKSSIRTITKRQGAATQPAKSLRNQALASSSRPTNTKSSKNRSVDNQQSNNQIVSASYSTVEEVFNRKIILEKERDKLKKEVEMVIVECDKLQQKYKRRDEILDKLFDGRTGNGLENHLEQQLNWLMEQKHYVDQVFYAWKRAETLTSQTCEQFASALELLKRLPKAQTVEERDEITKSIAHLLIKSRQDMEQAQKYNPNVDAPFFTDTETERFDKIIETISQTQSTSQSEYSQIATVIQFAYKRAVSIRLWLEQILQITIARDSFELAEEYKWIAIQLRKERIILINSKLQEAPYRAMAHNIREQMALQQQQQQNQQQNATEDGKTMIITNSKNEINRDSGVESDDIDIEEEIYRLLEMNKSRLEAAVALQQHNNLSVNNMSATTGAPTNSTQSAESSNQQRRDEIMRERIQRRVRGEQPLALDSRQPPIRMMNNHELSHSAAQSTASTVVSTPSKLRVELDEASRQSLLSKYF